MEAIRTEIVTTILMYSKEIGAVIQEANGTDLEIFFSSLFPWFEICLFSGISYSDAKHFVSYVSFPIPRKHRDREKFSNYPG